MSENIQVITATLILEIIGRPKEHLVETLEKIIADMDKEKGTKVIRKQINEPVLMKDQKDLYTTFAEIDVEVEDILYLTILMFKYMPAHVEVVSPELIALTNSGWSDILSELTRRLHKYDEVARVIQTEKTILEKKLREVLKDNKAMKEKIEPTEKKTEEKEE